MCSCPLVYQVHRIGLQQIILRKAYAHRDAKKFLTGTKTVVLVSYLDCLVPKILYLSLFIMWLNYAKLAEFYAVFLVWLRSDPSVPHSTLVLYIIYKTICTRLNTAGSKGFCVLVLGRICSVLILFLDERTVSGWSAGPTDRTARHYPNNCPMYKTVQRK